MLKRWMIPGAALALIGLGLVFYTLLRAPVEASAAIEAVPIDESAPRLAVVDAATTRLFEISPEGSQARFVVEEVLVGSPNTVVGVTEQVAGQIRVNLDDPTQSEVGTLQINARTLATDDPMRDRAVQQRILQSDRWEFITFQPNAYVGLPSSAVVGESYSFQIIGDLTIRDVTREASWEVTVNALSADRLEGSATATIPYTQWGVRIPQVPFVASVSDSVRLELDFTATSR